MQWSLLCPSHAGGRHHPAQAKAALDEILIRSRKEQAIVKRRAPTFAIFAESCLEFHWHAKDTKRASTMATESHAVNRLKQC